MTPLEWLISRMLEAACARARRESARAAELLTALTGQRLAIRVLGTPWAERPLCIRSDGLTLTLLEPTPQSPANAASQVPAAGPIAVSAGSATEPSAAPAQATLIGAPLSLLALAGTDPEAPIRRGDVRIDGDAQVAQRYRELAVLLVPDLEDSLARVMGRTAAHLTTRGVRSATELVRTATWNSVQNLADFLAHESRDLVSRHEAEHFLGGVDELRERFDRLEARLSDLERRAEAVGGATGTT